MGNYVHGQYGYTNETTADMQLRAERMMSGKLISPANLQSLIMSISLGRSDVFASCLQSQMAGLQKTSEAVASLNEDMNKIREQMKDLDPEKQEYKNFEKDLQVKQTRLDELSNLSQRQMIQLNMYVHKYEEAVKMGSDIEKAFNDANQAIQGNLK